MKRKGLLKNEEGFTLIEIIAVIIIMGILAAVAVPKFFSMQEDAKVAALNGALSEAAARFNHAYARFILDEKRSPTAMTDLAASAYLGANADAATGEDIGDFIVRWSKDGTDGLVIQVLTMETITDATLAAMPASQKTKTITGVSWN